MSGSLQSHDYVQGMSGLRIDFRTGELELNSLRLQVGSLPSDPQLVTVIAGEWSDSDLPRNAIERYKFIGDQVMKIPEGYRDSAEFTAEGFWLDRDGTDHRTTLTYQRRETAEEVEARQEKAKAGGSGIKLLDGVLTITHDGVVRAQLTGLLDLREPEQTKPFKVEGGKVYINEDFLAEGMATSADLHAAWFGPCMCAGGYTGTVSEPGAALKAGGVNAALDRMAAVIRETKLYEPLLADPKQLKTSFADDVKDVIRSELRQGGLLWRRG